MKDVKQLIALARAKPGELTYASELVELIRGVGDFSVGVAAHPEPHPHSPSLEEDRRHTAAKLAAADLADDEIALLASMLAGSVMSTSTAAS